RLRLRADDEPGGLEPRDVVVVHLVAVAMALRDRLLAVDAEGERVALHRAGLRAQAHGAAEVRAGVAPLHAPVVVLPFGDERDHGVRRVRIELRGIRALEAALVARDLDRGDLHAEADAEVGNPVLTRVLHGRDLALDPALAEAAGDEHRVHLLERLDAVRLELLGIDVMDVHFRARMDAR